jgi:TPR repeat protein
MQPLKVPFKNDDTVISPEMVMAAEMGYPSAQYACGKAYYDVRAYGQALFYFMAASHCDYGPAEHLAGLMLWQGWGCVPDYPQAFILTKRALANGVVETASNLAFMYEYGIGTRKCKRLAFLSAYRGATAGLVESMMLTGVYYVKGFGIPRDFDKAKDWLNKAAEKGSLEAKFELAKMRELGLGYTADPVLAMTQMEELAQQGDMSAQYRLGFLYDTGRGIYAKDKGKAYSYYLEAAKQGHKEAQYHIGLLLADKENLSRDLKAAYFWFWCASSQGVDEAALEMRRYKNQYTWDQLAAYMQKQYNVVL